MAGLIPRFIVSSIRTGQFSGSFTGSVLLFDVSGFTPLTEKLSQLGNAGADSLSAVVNTLFPSRLLKQIHSAGGSVSGFSGDSFTVILPGISAEPGETLASEIFSLISSSIERSYLKGVRELSIRAGSSYGEVEWVITGNGFRTWFFTGPAVSDVYHAMDSAEPGGIVFSRLNGRRMENPPSLPDVRSSRKLESGFFPDVLLDSGRSGEFRRVFPVFLAPEPSRRNSACDLESITSDIMTIADSSGGYFNGVHHDIKGPYLLTLFGAPWSYENDGYRAVLFSKRALSECRGIGRIGIASGTVFAGNIGFKARSSYTVLGNQVNAAARIMRYSDEPGIYVTEDVLDRIPHSTENLVNVSRVSLKGISESTGVIRVDPESLHRISERFESKLIGREKELRLILDRAGPLLSIKNCGSIIISGPAGVGKSHLIHEVCSRMERLNCWIIRLQCSDITDRSFEPIVSYFRKFFRQVDSAGEPENRSTFSSIWLDHIETLASSGSSDSGFLDELERTRPFAEALLGIAESDSIYHTLEAEGRHENMLLAIRNFLESIAYRQPLVLIVEDIQWIDGASRETLELLSRSPGSVPLIIICSCRPSDVGTLPDIALNAGNCESLTLENLEAASLPELAGSIISALPGTELLRFLSARTLNNPFYVEQYLKYLQETGSIEESENGWELKVEPDTIPDGISDVLIARLDRLSGNLKRLVQTASVLGYEFNTDVLSEMYRGKVITPLLLSGTRFEIWTSLEQVLYIFHHSLLRDAAYGMQLKSDIIKLHELAALSIETLYNGRKEFYPDLAYHYEQAGNFPSACRYLRKAAEISEDDYHLEECLGYLKRLLDLNGIGGEKPGLMLRSAKILTALSRWDEAIELAENALLTAEKTGDREVQADAASSKAWLLLRKGQYEEAAVFMDRAESIYSSTQNIEGTARILGYRGVLSFNSGNYLDAEKVFLKVLNIWQKLGIKREVLKILSNLGCVYKDIGDTGKAEAFFNRSIELSQEERRQDILATSLGNRATLYRNVGRFDEAVRDFHRSIAISESIGDRRGLSAQLGGLALIKYDKGDFREAIELYTRQLNISTELGYTFGIAEAHGYLGTCYDDTGNLSEAEMHYDECIRISRDINLAYYTGIFLGMKALLLFTKGKYHESLEANEESIDICTRLGINEILVTGRLLRQQLRIATSRDKTEILSALDRMKAQMESENDPSSKATAAFQFWKTLKGTERDIQRSFDLNLVREEAVALAKAAMDNRPCYSHRKMIEELEAGIR